MNPHDPNPLPSADAAPSPDPARELGPEPNPVPPPGLELASVIVLCCNELAFTRLCLENVLRHSRPPYELVLLDNGSTDGTPAFLEEIRTRPGPLHVEVIRNPTN